MTCTNTNNHKDGKKEKLCMRMEEQVHMQYAHCKEWPCGDVEPKSLSVKLTLISLLVLIIFTIVKTMSLRKPSFFIVCTESIRKYICRVHHQLSQYIAKLNDRPLQITSRHNRNSKKSQLVTASNNFCYRRKIHRNCYKHLFQITSKVIFKSH